MIFTPEERRALLAFGAVLVFGQILAWVEDWRIHAPDRELAEWLNRVGAVRAEADSAAGARVPEPVGAPAGPLPAGGDPVSVSATTVPLSTTEGPVTAPVRAPAAPAPSGEFVREEPLTSLPPGILETGKIRIDLATAEELTALPGIGPALAARIVATRAETPFRAVDDLLQVKGVGPKTLARLRDHVSVESLPGDADSSRGEQHVDAAESRRRSQASPGGPHQ